MAQGHVRRHRSVDGITYPPDGSHVVDKPTKPTNGFRVQHCLVVPAQGPMDWWHHVEAIAQKHAMCVKDFTSYDKFNCYHYLQERTPFDLAYDLAIRELACTGADKEKSVRYHEERLPFELTKLNVVWCRLRGFERSEIKRKNAEAKAKPQRV